MQQRLLCGWYTSLALQALNALTDSSHLCHLQLENLKASLVDDLLIRWPNSCMESQNHSLLSCVVVLSGLKLSFYVSPLPHYIGVLRALSSVKSWESDSLSCAISKSLKASRRASDLRPLMKEFVTCSGKPSRLSCKIAWARRKRAFTSRLLLDSN